MKKILNLTQHQATPEQQLDGVIEPKDKEEVFHLLTFDKIPSHKEMENRAKKLAQIAKNHGVKYAMIGGTPYFMAYLEAALIYEGIIPLYAFSRRESVEKTLPDGSVKKTQVFKHLGFIRGGEIIEKVAIINHDGGYYNMPLRYYIEESWE